MAIVSHEAEFRAHLGTLASGDRYVIYLRRIAELTDRDITPKSLRTDQDVETFAARLAGKCAHKSILNYKSVMRHYVGMVRERRLATTG